MTMFVFLERGGSIGALWHATWTNADAAGARSSNSMTNGAKGNEFLTSNNSVLRFGTERIVVQFHNEIDHIIFNRKYCLTDVSVVPKFYTGSDHRLLRARFRFSRQGEKAAKFKKKSRPRTTINWDLYTSLAGLWEDAVMDNVDEEYDRFVHHFHDSAKGAESLKTTKRRLSPETLELIRQRGAARASGNYQLMSELAKLCREAIKEDLKERRAEVLAESAEAGLGIRNARRNFANFKTKMTALRRPDGIVTSSRRTTEKVGRPRNALRRHPLDESHHRLDSVGCQKNTRTPTNPLVGPLNDRYDALRVPRARRIQWTKLARDRDEWRRCWHPLEQFDDQRDDG
ncbi:unnamed protein product [Heligmosomoides polygyrus]|uniref:Endo/exonuclease/phosphatase domain-containing protein n=1 Tax=Heligmosomoides polygyrus TaxID=6339 RepID=A0A3P7YR59_HELPZ|nr:unnamed protein product [Heligmosomoides polygyrus]